ncbi:MAG TPA: radical SAM family heme chaperone HemW [Chloroflexia bacterium]|nr:radical SAM family heme chaperone HemW [Chloroflexia bacterium]
MVTIARQDLRRGAVDHYWRSEPVGLYLHIPFCESKCIYCDFNSYAGMLDKHGPFVNALCKDIVHGVALDLNGEPDCEGAEVSTVFFGGGTPSVLTHEQIGKILAAARSRYRIAPDAEVTMEANPGTISLESFRGYRQAGINRLSMGVQVLDDAMLKKLGRIHTADGALQSYRWAREAGFDNVNLDFIYGLPGQTIDHFAAVLDRLLELDPLPDHLSCYSLIVEEHTPLYVGVSKGLISVPGEDQVAEMYELMAARLPTAGYTQYEISNWSRGKPCRHNLVYWHNGRYLAFGPGASGYWGNTRYSTLLAPGEYIQKVNSGESAIDEQNVIGPDEEMDEFMMLGLRLNEGVSEQKFRHRFGVDVESVYGATVRMLVGQGLLCAEGDYIRLTDRGRLLGNEAFQRFLR